MKTKLSRAEATRAEAARAGTTQTEAIRAGTTQVGGNRSPTIKAPATRIYFSAPPKKNTTRRHCFQCKNIKFRTINFKITWKVFMT